MIDPAVQQLVLARVGRGPATSTMLVNYIRDHLTPKEAELAPIHGTIYEMLRDGQLERVAPGMNETEGVYRLPATAKIENGPKWDGDKKVAQDARTPAQIAWEEAAAAIGKRGSKLSR